MRNTILTATLLSLLSGAAFAGDWEVNDNGLVVTVSSISHDVTIVVEDEEQGEAVAKVLNDYDDKKKKKKPARAS